MTFATSQDWLAHKGTVGRAINGVVHIVGDDNETDLPARQEGAVFFESEQVFEYHDDAEKTASSRNAKGWTTLGDVGRSEARRGGKECVSKCRSRWSPSN